MIRNSGVLLMMMKVFTSSMASNIASKTIGLMIGCTITEEHETVSNETH